jgi:FkbM family methyltransferase
VIAVTLDSLLNHFEAPDVLKIDVEGMEYAVLRRAGEFCRQGHAFFFAK